MGIHFNPDNESFKRTVRSEIYIDKTGLLEFLNARLGTEKNCISVSHARRFGKSQAAGMIDAYYSRGSDSRELFSKFKIAGMPDFEEHLNKYNVIHLHISSFADLYTDNLVEKITERLYKEFKSIYNNIDYDDSINNVLAELRLESGTQFVIIIDEWDCIIRNMSERQDLVHKYLQFLHLLFKSEESKSFLALAYITGILPVKKIDDESALNNFKEYTMLDSKELTEYFGFTEKEVEKLCKKFSMSFDSAREWYDGYIISGQHIYNPNSICNAMSDRSFESYWKNTSHFRTINKYTDINFDGMKDDILTMLSGGRISVDTESFQNDLSEIHSKDDAFTALAHLGYIGYDSKCGEMFVPNFEVSKAWQTALKAGSWHKIAATISKCEELLKATICRDAARVAELVELAHEAYTSVLKYNDENSLSCVITMAYFTAPAYYNVMRELPAGKGFADFAFIPRSDAGDKPAMIIELKWDKTADTALKQIKEKRYAGNLAGYGKNILLVGISYNKDGDNKKHECMIEQI